jgi:hypothetical protein
MSLFSEGGIPMKINLKIELRKKEWTQEIVR